MTSNVAISIFTSRESGQQILASAHCSFNDLKESLNFTELKGTLSINNDLNESLTLFKTSSINHDWLNKI